MSVETATLSDVVAASRKSVRSVVDAAGATIVTEGRVVSDGAGGEAPPPPPPPYETIGVVFVFAVEVATGKFDVALLFEPPLIDCEDGLDAPPEEALDAFSTDRVLGPTEPTGSSPFFFWNRFTASSVFAPKYPLTSPSG
jgi:hypothetical protein